jgi:hypothetical protein
MKPVFGKAATSAPKDASFKRTRAFSEKATVTSTISSAESSHSAKVVGLSSSSTGVLLPKRNSMQGSAK